MLVRIGVRLLRLLGGPAPVLEPKPAMETPTAAWEMLTLPITGRSVQDAVADRPLLHRRSPLDGSRGRKRPPDRFHPKFATRMLGEVVEFDFEVAPGDSIEEGQAIGWFEGFKAVSDLYTPLGRSLSRTEPGAGRVDRRYSQVSLRSRLALSSGRRRARDGAQRRPSYATFPRRDDRPHDGAPVHERLRRPCPLRDDRRIPRRRQDDGQSSASLVTLHVAAARPSA